MSQRRLAVLLLLLAGVVPFLAGCPVYQPPGQGKKLHVFSKAADRWYWLYVPVGYNAERRHPLVVTLHGMKPYDSARPHVQMWGKLADEHGYLVLAPELQTSDSFGQFPLKVMRSAEKRDVQCVMTIMDEVIKGWEVDRNSVLLTSWSMGGYLASYIAAEYGDRFTAFAPLQSNFCADSLDAAKARRFANRLPVFIFYGSVDLGAVTGEAREAVEWFRSLGYSVTTKEAGIGHERHPELAAQFFEHVLAGQYKDVEIVVTPPGPEPAPLAVNLWPSLSSRIGEVRTYIWDFGTLGGGPSYSKAPNVLIRLPGHYPVRLTVIDSAGRRHIAQATINVAPTAAARNSSPVRGTRTP